MRPACEINIAITLDQELAMGCTEGFLRRNETDRWEVGEVELTSGCQVEILIEEHWIRGVIEYWADDYYWFSQRGGVPVILHSGIKARVSESNFGRCKA